jgi:acyl CoA:acetate/3-ketoacid CoA transferase
LIGTSNEKELEDGSMVHQHIESEKLLTVHICSGTILKQELINTVKALYDSEPTPNHLWDLTETDFSKINADDLKDIAEFAKQYAPTRIGCRTALVAASALGFGLARMYEAFSENTGQCVEISVFHSRKEAEEWISAVSGNKFSFRNTLR